MSREQALKHSKLASPQASSPLSRSFRYTVDAEKRLIAVSFGKKLTVQQIKRYSDLLQMNPSFQPTYSEIVDLTQVEELDLQADEFLTLADKIDPFSTYAKRAFVVRTPVQNHAARMHKVLRAHRNIEIFRSMEEAECWIATNS